MPQTDTTAKPEAELEYEDIQRLCRENLGTIIRFPENGEERVYFSRGEYTDQHEIVIQAALWVRTDRPSGSSKYKTFILKGLKSSSGSKSTVADGAYADDYCEAIEWIAEESAAFDGEPINWLDLPKKVYPF